MYQIVRIYPLYHAFTDAMIGSAAQRLPMAYHSEALAHKLAGRLTDEDYRSCGDDHFVVVPYGESPFRFRLPAPAAPADDCPF